MNDVTELKERFLQFSEAHWMGVWVPALLQLPFGAIAPLFPGDDVTWLHRCDLETEYSFEEIRAVVEDTAKRYFCPPGFYFTNGWRGDIEGFQAYIKDHGYVYSHTNSCLYLSDRDVANNVDKSRVTIEQCHDTALFLKLYQTCFDPHPVIKQRVQYMMERRLNAVSHTFYVARETETNEAIGLFCIDRDPYGYSMAYTSMVGIIPDYRGRGLSKAMGAHMIDVMAEDQHIFVAISDQNIPSIKMHQALGYQSFDDWQVWVKR